MIINIPAQVVFIFVVLAVWELFWKAISMWKAARADHRVWYIVLLFINSAGILPIIYLAFFADNAWFKPHPKVEIIPKRKSSRRAG